MEGLTSVKLNLFKPKDADIAQREGIKIDKGAILTSQYLEKIEGLLRKYISFFTAYPDLFLDLITSSRLNPFLLLIFIFSSN